jgi:hypothetical protein
VDVSSTGAGANGPSLKPQITSDAARIIFQSNGSNLVPGDTNNATDVFVGSPFGGGSFRVSLTSGGGEANGSSFDGSIGDDGRFVSFASDATNVVSNDNNGVTDIFARDLQGAGVTVAISFTATFTTGNGASTQPRSSRDGRWVTFRSFANDFGATDTNGVADIYVNAIGSGQPPFRVSVSSSGAQANGPSFQSALSFRGNAVAFVSSASNLVSGDTNFTADTFVRDLGTNQTIRIQRDPTTQPNASAVLNSSLSFSGNESNTAFAFLAFDSLASNLVFGDTNAFADVFSASLSP